MVTQTLGPTQTRKFHAKLEKGVTRQSHNKRYKGKGWLRVERVGGPGRGVWA